MLNFSQLRDSVIRDLNKFESVFWLGDLEDPIQTIVQDNGKEADFWLKVVKPIPPSKPTFPALPAILRGWVVEETLTRTQGEPDLRPSFTDTNGHISPVSSQIEDVFLTYCIELWPRHKQEYQQALELFKQQEIEYQRTSKVYRELFDTFKKIQNFGDEYELLMGFGLLCQSENTFIKRHVFTVRAAIEFVSNTRTAYIEVKPDLSNSRYFIESDMCQDLEGFNVDDAQRVLANALENAEMDDYFSKQFFGKEGFLNQYTNVLHTQAQYYDNVQPINKNHPKPTVYFAPALILRRRTTRSLTAVYKKIIEQLEEGESIDASCVRAILEADAPIHADIQRSLTFKNDSVYFPKPYNDEQISIVNRLRINNKVLVQGPPGTGKSHTIANLLCHLLAHGNRVLVTAQTKRALESLKDKIPEEIKALAVSMLGDDIKSANDLEQSVNTITTKLNDSDIDSLGRKIKLLEEQLNILYKSKAEHEYELRLLKEKDCRKQTLNSLYKDTLDRLAERIIKEQPYFEWFTDALGCLRERISTEFCLPDHPHLWYELANVQSDFEKLFELTTLCNAYNPEDLQGNLPDLGSLLSAQVLKDKFLLISNFEEKYNNKNPEVISGVNLDLLSEQIQKRESAIRNIDKIIQDLIALPKYSWNDNVWNDCSGKVNALGWQSRVSKTQSFLEKDFAKLYDRFTTENKIQIHNFTDFQTLRNDAKVLLNYLESKNKTKISFGFIDKLTLPSDIKERERFVNEVKINGSLCDETSELKLAISYFDFRIDCENILNTWKDDKSLKYDENLHINLKQRLSTLKDVIQKSEDYLIEETTLKNAENILFELIKIRNINENQIKLIVQNIDYTKDIQINETAKNQIQRLLDSLQQPYSHPISQSLHEAVKNQNWLEYQALKDQLTELIRIRIHYEEFRNLTIKCAKILPKFTANIVEDRSNAEQIKSLSQAIYWHNANTEIRKQLNQSETELYEKLKKEETNIRDITAQLAAEKAWVEVLSRIDNSLSSKLTRWAMAMKRAHGKGKKALQNRKAAQELMADCQQSVPCWIMPLPKLVETLQPEPAIYDYVIVDEASQLGPDAMFLMYLAKNIIIVGDDKQTAPQYVGVENDKVQDLINQHLKNIPYNSFFNIDYSFFDHANAFCSGQKVVLREHFRCMPEIIEFCNKHFYQSAGIGLHPLKQYNDNRLEPLKTVFVKGGYTEGESTTIRNSPEVDELIKTIQACLMDKRYKDKTFGIIALQGQLQAQMVNQKLLTLIDAQEFEHRKIICGDAKSFQGDERDVMFLSLVTAPNHKRRALTTSEFERMFNVAVSRAIEQVWLFHSVQLEDLTNKDDLRYKLLSYFQNPLEPPIISNKEIEGVPKPFDSQFEVEVYNEIVKRGYTVTPQYSVGHYKIDLVVLLPNGVKIAVECDGDKYHSTPDQIANDIGRQKVLERAGWQFFRIRGGDYYYYKSKALEGLWALLERNCPPNVPLKVNENEIIQDSAFTTKSTIPTELINLFSPPEPSIGFTQARSQEGTVFVESEVIKPKSNEQLEVSEIIKSPILPKFSNKFKSHPDALKYNTILAFTDQHRVYSIKNQEFNNIESFLVTLELELNENPIYFCGTTQFNGFMLFGFENGKVAKIHMSAYKTRYQQLEAAFSSHSSLCFISYIENDIELLAHSKVADNRIKAFIFNTENINPVSSRSSIGVQVMRLGERGGKLDGLKTLDKVLLTNQTYYLRKDIPQTGFFLKEEEGDTIK